MTHLPNGPALKMDGARACHLCCPRRRAVGVKGRGGCGRGCAWARLKRPPVQILVVVASIRAGSLKTEVEKGFRRTLLGPE